MLLAAGQASAAPQVVSWADWVGSYDAKLVWRSCSAPGTTSAQVSLDASDAVVTVDLTGLGAGFRPMSLVDEAAGWSAQQGDVKVRLTRPRTDQLELIVELDSGCTIRGQLRRASTGVATCDRLLGWARVEARCTKLSAARLADALPKKWRASDAASCARRATELETSLIDAGCAPHPDPMIGVRAPRCLALAAASARLSRCGTAPADLKQTFTLIAGALASAAQSAEPSTLPYVEQQCEDEQAMLAAVARRFSCLP